MTARNKGLDVLRAIAVFMTFGRHMVEPVKGNMPGIVYSILRLWVKTGWAGVALFFVLSGYLVSSLMFNEFLNSGGAIRFGRFYIRRGLKIYPAFYFLLACTIGLCVADLNWIHRGLVDTEKISPQIVLSEIFFLQNYLGHFWAHVWSLAVEEHFYISLGLIIYFILKVYPLIRPNAALRDRFVWIPWICAAVFVAAFAFRYFYLAGHPRTMDERFAASGYTHHRIDSLFFGVLLAYFAKFRSEWFLTWVKTHTIWLLVLGLVLIAPSLRYEETDDFMLVPGDTLMYLGFGCLLLFTLYHPWKSWGRGVDRATDALAYVGQNSYSVYLWHFPVMFILARFMSAEGKNYFVLIAVQNVVGLIAGLVMAKLVEMPVLALRDRYFTPTKALGAGVPVNAGENGRVKDLGFRALKRKALS